MRQIQVSQDDVNINGDTVELLRPNRWRSQPRKAQTLVKTPKMDDAVNKSSTTSTAVLQQDVLLLKKMLQDGPLSWSDFADEYAKHRPVKSIETLQETIYQSSPNDFLYSSDFISLHNSRSVALLKLQLIVVANNRLQNEQLGKISYHFNVSASDKERVHFGRNSQQLGESLEKLPQLFSVLDNGSHTQDSESKARDLKEVNPSSKTLLFHSFFSEEGDNKTSFIHKLQYFINLCGGKSSLFSLYEFARNLLKGAEKAFFKNEKDSFVQTISNLHNHFQVLGDEIKLHQHTLWHQQLKKMTQMANVEQDVSAHNKIQKVQASTAPQPAEVLTADFVKNVLNNVARYPMDWNEFKTKFLKSKQNADAMIANFLQNCPQKALKSLCFSSDFLALNTPFHRNRLKLQLILAIRRKSAEPSLISLENFKMQFDEIASEQEIEQTELNCDDFRGFLDKFPRVFVIQKGNYVKQGREALQFPSFFQHEKDGPLVSVVHKLNYFVYLCGDYCSISLVCKFLQRHLKLKRELDLVNTDEKVLALIQNCERGALNLDGDEDKENLEVTETDEERKATAADRARDVEDILKTQNHAISWRHLENLCFTKNKSKDWVSKFRQHYLPVLDSNYFIFSREFISLNSSYDRVLLKLCLLVNLYVMKKGQCELQSLFKQLQSIASGVEKREFYVNPDYQSYLSKHPNVFKLDIKASGKCYVSPGEDMVSFADLFTCEEHHKEDCLQCQLWFFMKVCGGRSHHQKCHNFVQILLNFNEENDKNGKKMSAQEVDDFIQKCGIVKDDLNPDVYVITELAVSTRNDQANDTSKVSSVPDKNHQPLRDSTEGNSQSSPSTQGNSASSSSSKVNLQSVPPKEDCPQPSSVSQEAESTPLKSAEVTLISSCNNSSSEINRLVKVKIVRTDKILSQVIDRMLKFERPIISMVHRKDALVILNWEGKGFVIPFKKTDLVSSSDSAFAQKWTLLGEFFQNPKVTQVTFDCHAIGRFLLENFNLQLNDTVFDVKIGAELLPSECSPTSVNNVADLCRCLNLPSLDKVDVQIVGDLVPKQGEEMVTLEKSSVTEAVREASALIPGIYGKMFQSLQEIDALKTLHSLTGDKLQSLYSMNIDSLLPLDKYYPSELTDTEPMKQSSSQSSISTGSSVPVSSISLSGMVSSQRSSQRSSVDPVAKPPPSGYSEIKGSAEDWFSTDVDQLPTIPTGIKEIFNQNQFSVKPSLPGTPLISYLQNQAFSMKSLTTQSLPQGFLSNQQPDFEPSMMEGLPLSLCKDEVGSIIQVPVEEAGSYDQNLSGITDELLNDFTSQHKESMLQLLLLLGMDIFETLRSHYKGDFCDSFNWLTDIVLDLGRNAEARFFRHTKDETPETVVASSRVVTAKDLAEIEKTDTLTGFGDDNRCGIEGALHSLRQVRNKKKRMVGLTVRVHKPLLGCADMMYDIALNGKSTLIIGYSGVGKTTLLRELARCLNDSARKRVIVVDTYNEIAGDYDVPHFSIGGARRLQVDSHDNQYKTLLESAKNHSPEVLIVDEIENQNDVAAVIKLCQQGIQVIAGVDTESISNLFNDKNFYQLFQSGGDNRLDDSVSLDSAGALAKSKVRPSFQALVEMVGCSRWYVHDLAHTYNCCLSGQPYSVQERTRIGFRPGQVREQQIVLKEKLIG
ncbi:hypothetical protein HOLleu_05035 [Holothuria leucospilota]|uniref:AAA+ ATPase domain-containing protein n=1 Tax=Holothuria leucospilota TaxID=206669 RepID=A0A9Q1CJ34_HOLLE|nr:hypothetical protein HOLleu_05035 [Holothuria leucospilota]